MDNIARLAIFFAVKPRPWTTQGLGFYADEQFELLPLFPLQSEIDERLQKLRKRDSGRCGFLGQQTCRCHAREGVYFEERELARAVQNKIRAAVAGKPERPVRFHCKTLNESSSFLIKGRGADLSRAVLPVFAGEIKERASQGLDLNRR